MMRSLKIAAVWGIAGGLALAASSCGGLAHDDGPAELDARDASLADLGEGKADAAGFREGTVEALGILRVANEVAEDALRRDVGLTSLAAAAVAAYRAGVDGRVGTADDRRFTTLTEVDAVPWIGPASITRMLAYARARGLVPATVPPPPPPPADYAALFASAECAGPALTLAEALRFLGDADRATVGPLGSTRRVRDCNSSACPWRLVQETVGTMSLVRKQRRYYESGYLETYAVQLVIDVPASVVTGQRATSVPCAELTASPPASLGCNAYGVVGLPQPVARLKLTKTCASLVPVDPGTGRVPEPLTHFAKGGFTLKLPPLAWTQALIGAAAFGAVTPSAALNNERVVFASTDPLDRGQASVWALHAPGAGGAVSTNVKQANQLVADDHFAWWTRMGSQQTEIWRGPRGLASTGGGPATFVAYGSYVAKALAQDATHVYIAAQRRAAGVVRDAPGIYRLGKEMEDAVDYRIIARAQVVPNTTQQFLGPTSLAVDDTHVYWTEPDAGKVLRIAKAPTPTALPTVLVVGEQRPHGIVVDATHAYFGAGAGLRKVAKSGGAVATVPSGWFGAVSPSALAADATHLYYSVSGELHRIPKAGVPSGGASERLVDYPKGAAAKLEVDDAWIFWLGQSGGPLYGLEK